MDVWQLGLIVLIVAGLGLIIFGALWDRNRNRKRATEMLAPPKREFPHFRPDAPAPHYLSDLQARRPPRKPSSPALADERSALKVRIAEADILTIKTGYASKDFVTDKGTGWGFWIVLGAGLRRPGQERPRAATRARTRDHEQDAAGDRRTPAGRRGASHAGGQPDPPDHSPAGGDPRRGGPDHDRRGDRSGVIDRSDRQSGYVPFDKLGRCERWVSTANASHMIISD